MSKEIISNKQGASTLILFVIGSSIVLGTGGVAKQDAWISIILALLMAIPFIYVYSKLLSLYPGLHLFDILHKVLGRLFGKIFSVLYIWYFFHLGALVIRNFSEFIQIVSLPDTPQLLITILLTLLSIWAVKSGIEVLSRLSAFILPIIMFFIIGTLVLSLPKIDVNNLRPVLYNGIQPVLSEALLLFAFPFAETVVFTMVFNKLKQSKHSFKLFFNCILIAGLLLLLATLRNMMVLGVNVSSAYYFPSYIAVRTVNFGEFIQRIEVTIAVIYILAGFVKVSICLYAAAIGTAKVLNIEKYNYIVAPVGFLMMNLASIVYQSSMEMFDWALNVYPYYALPFQVVLPLSLLIAALFKVRKEKK